MTKLNSTPPAWRRFIAPGIAFALVAALGVALLRPKDASSGVGDPLLGKAAPTFVLKTLDGGTVSLEQLKGKPLVLNFWASWCVPCRDEAPLLREASEKQSAAGLNVVGVLFQDPDKTRMRKFIADYGLAYPNLLDSDLKTSINYGITGVPETFFIGTDGLIKSVDRGGLTRERLSAGLQSIGVTF
ncbi:TlpA family protein disulfide reductase [Deinococcus detaillensis]|uniref:TlpA family protein disulfide reductase n=1 Tax=Deinococcus detaillensis TaxID=2592048 RepID=A0A553UUD5_9DEIO|nr:TlpA disulfide reductase family protein [Deinococcus detaillensis]TSA83820.1 TlpA family protein disulfide reductase [Deinococcus detaillensis]